METFKDKYLLYAFYTALIIVSIFPGIFQTLFVHHSGKFVSIGLGWALIIIIAIYKKWKHSKLLFNLVFIPAILFELFIILNIDEPYFLRFVLLILAQIGLVIVFNFSNFIQNRFQSSISI